MDKIAKATARERVVQFLLQSEEEFVPIVEIKSKFKDIPLGTISSVLSGLQKTGLFSVDSQKRIYKSAVKPFTADEALLAMRKAEEKVRDKKAGKVSKKLQIDYDHIIELAENLLAALRVNRKTVKQLQQLRETVAKFDLEGGE